MTRARATTDVTIAVITATVIALGVAVTTGQAGGSPPPAQPVTAAVFANERLWLRVGSGNLLSLGEGDARPRTAASNVAAICRSGGDLLAVSVAGPERWTVKRRRGEGWIDGATVPVEGDDIVALACSTRSQDAALVTRTRVVDLQSKGHTVRVPSRLEGPIGETTALLTPNAIWVGRNIGEWGGGLTRIDRDTGGSDVVEANPTGRLCGGPLNSGCDPVTGLVESPFHAGCVVATIGLDHMMGKGRVVEVCENRVRRLYFKDAPLPQFDKRKVGETDDGEPFSTVAFFGAARTSDSLWAVGSDGLYRFDRSTTPHYQPLPRFENRGGYGVSFAVPGVALVATDINRQHSMSDVTPLIAAR